MIVLAITLAIGLRAWEWHHAYKAKFTYPASPAR